MTKVGWQNALPVKPEAEIGCFARVKADDLFPCRYCSTDVDSRSLWVFLEILYYLSRHAPFARLQAFHQDEGKQSNRVIRNRVMGITTT